MTVTAFRVGADYYFTRQTVSFTNSGPGIPGTVSIDDLGGSGESWVLY